jgi:hypothetical protein
VIYGAAPLTRRLVSKDELAEILSTRVQQLSGAESCSITRILRLARPSEDGRNWLPGIVSARCWQPFLEVFMKAQHEFNLADE